MQINSQNKLRSVNKGCQPARKLMMSIFCDRTGVLIVGLMQQGTKITSEVYCKTLRKLRKAIQNKGHGMLTSGVVLLNGNELSHTSARTRALLEHLTGRCLTTLLKF
jgi:hypothetical protein